MCDDGSDVLTFWKFLRHVLYAFIIHVFTHLKTVWISSKQIFNCESPSRRWLFQISVELWLHLMPTSESRENFIFFYRRLKNILLPVVVLFSVRSDITLTVIIVFFFEEKKVESSLVDEGISYDFILRHILTRWDNVYPWQKETA